MRKSIKITILLFLLLMVRNSFAQTMYINREYAEMQGANFTRRFIHETIKSSQLDEIAKQKDKIAKNYSKVLLAKEVAYKSLYEVNNLLKDGLQVKYLFEISTDVHTQLRMLSKEIYDYPEGTVFLQEYIKEVSLITVSIVEEANKILRSDPKMLMSHSERDEIIQNLIHKVKMLTSSIELTRIALQSAKRLGFWKKMNPFKDMIHYDRMIMQDVIRKAKMF